MSRVGARIILLILCLLVCVPLIMYFTGDKNIVGTNTQAEISELSVPDEDPLLSNLEAMDVVMAQLPGSDIDDVMECTQSYEEGGWVYEGSIKGKKAGYEFRVDGDNGNLLKWEVADKQKH